MMTPFSGKQIYFSVSKAVKADERNHIIDVFGLMGSRNFTYQGDALDPGNFDIVVVIPPSETTRAIGLGLETIMVGKGNYEEVVSSMEEHVPVYCITPNSSQMDRVCGAEIIGDDWKKKFGELTLVKSEFEDTYLHYSENCDDIVKALEITGPSAPPHIRVGEDIIRNILMLKNAKNK